MFARRCQKSNFVLFFMSIRASLEQLLLRRFFLCPSFEIYGAVAGLYDYGPPLTLLQQHVLQEWRAHFCLEDNMLELECTNLTPEQVLRTSGHVERFADYMVTDTVTGDIFRADHLVKQTLEKRLPAANEQLKTEYAFLLETLDNYQGDELAALMKKLEIRAPETGNLVTEPVQFNLMFDTKIGPTGYLKGFLRPETAQGHFLNFRRLLDFNSDQMPFASASIGKSFRNEISPRQGLLRVREFTMAEIEHFVHPDKKQHARFSEVAHVKLPLYSRDAQLAAAGPTTYAISDAVASKLVDNETLGYFLARIYLFLLRIGISPEKVRFRQHLANEMAHYATDCWDAEILSSYGWIESVGCADRSAYDLTAHSKATGAKLVARETLAEPVTVTRRVLEIQKQKFGPAFKKDAKLVQAVLENSCVDGVWEKEVLDAFVTDLESKGYVTVKSSAGAEYKVTKEMITIVERTEKISGKTKRKSPRDRPTLDRVHEKGTHTPLILAQTHPYL